MLRYAIFIFIIILAAALQISAAINLFPAEAVPNVLLVLAVIWTARGGWEKNLPWIIASGFVFDLVSSRPVGISIIIFVLTTYVVGYLAKRYLISQRAWKLLFLVSVILLSSALSQILFFATDSLWNFFHGQSALPLASIINRQIIYKVLADLLVMFIFYWPAKKIESFLAIYEFSEFANRRRV